MQILCIVLLYEEGRIQIFKLCSLPSSSTLSSEGREVLHYDTSMINGGIK